MTYHGLELSEADGRRLEALYRLRWCSTAPKSERNAAHAAMLRMLNRIKETES